MVVLLFGVVAVVMCRFPPSMSFFTRSAHPIEQLKGKRILGKQAYIYIHIYIYTYIYICWRVSFGTHFFGFQESVSVPPQELGTVPPLHIYIYIYIYAVGFDNGAGFFDSWFR